MESILNHSICFNELNSYSSSMAFPLFTDSRDCRRQIFATAPHRCFVRYSDFLKCHSVHDTSWCRLNLYFTTRGLLQDPIEIHDTTKSPKYIFGSPRTRQVAKPADGNLKRTASMKDRRNNFINPDVSCSSSHSCLLSVSLSKVFP